MNVTQTTAINEQSETLVTESTGWAYDPEAAKQFSVFVLIQLFIGVLGVLGNFLVCFVFLHPRTQRDQINLLITNQAFVDLLTSVLLIVDNLTAIAPLPTPRVGLYLIVRCFLWKTSVLLYGTFAISSFNLTIISVERFVATIYPLSYVKLFTKRNVMWLIAGVWLIAPVMQVVLVTVSFVYQDDACVYVTPPKSVSILFFSWEYLTPVSIMTVSFIGISKKFRSLNRVSNDRARLTVPGTTADGMPVAETHNSSTGEGLVPRGNSSHETTISGSLQTNENNVASGNGPVHQHPVSGDGSRRTGDDNTRQLDPREGILDASSRQRRQPFIPARSNNARQRNVTTTLAVVYIVYIVCWTPNQWTFIRTNIAGYNSFYQSFYQFSVVLAIANSCVNPFIYALRHKVYKERVGEMLAGVRRKISSCRLGLP